MCSGTCLAKLEPYLRLAPRGPSCLFLLVRLSGRVFGPRRTVSSVEVPSGAIRWSKEFRAWLDPGYPTGLLSWAESERVQLRLCSSRWVICSPREATPTRQQGHV